MFQLCLIRGLHSLWSLRAQFLPYDGHPCPSNRTRRRTRMSVVLWLRPPAAPSSLRLCVKNGRHCGDELGLDSQLVTAPLYPFNDIRLAASLVSSDSNVIAPMAIRQNQLVTAPWYPYKDARLAASSVNSATGKASWQRHRGIPQGCPARGQLGEPCVRRPDATPSR